MHISCLGVSFRTASLAERERVAYSPASAGEARRYWKNWQTACRQGLRCTEKLSTIFIISSKKGLKTHV